MVMHKHTLAVTDNYKTNMITRAVVISSAVD